jgi:ribonuclease BN (tRNA processing enzyme)
MHYGGNTTCLRIMSQCLPPDTALLIDAGTGIVPASCDLLKEGIKRILLLMTHYHHDHTQGLPLAPHTFAKAIPIEVYGPREHGVGPRQAFETIMSAPFFPVDFAHVGSHITCHEMDKIGTDVLIIHRQTGARMMRLDEFTQLAEKGNVRSGPDHVALGDCLVVLMHKTTHPEYTVSYRFEERPTGKIFVLLTDHENTDSMPLDLRGHLSGANLLIQDAQYTREQYESGKAGYGHGTGDYSARVMMECEVGQLGQTHHDPMANDSDVDAIVEEARAWLSANGAANLCDRVFACADYQEIEV